MSHRTRSPKTRGGSFTFAGIAYVGGIAKWDGTQWSGLPCGVGVNNNPAVRALMVFDDGIGPALYAGGSFTTPAGVTVNSIAKWRCQVTTP